ncbi:MAG TPA: beta-ketoacyl synthase N-terminal-like domain-containing protein, partial [Rhodanobacter sp.]|nr:beta-ketoacyl synthase N-terminal-like domain-containing protein [Rhodanobacter sp.]
SARGGEALSYYERPALSTSYVAASNDVEQRIARVFQDVLGINKVGLDDNYFELGGNSLISLQLIAELQGEFNVPLSPILLFEAPSVSALTKHLLPVDEASIHVPAKLDMNKRRQRARHGTTRSSIAIIGMSGRFPGADDVKTFWNNALNGVESLTLFTDEELREAGVDPALIHNPAYVKARGIIEGIDLFDAGVFGFNPREAELMDPQHRLMLEVAWQTMEHAGYDSHRYDGPIGVFAGTMQSLYQLRLHSDRELWSGLDFFDTAMANTQDSLSTRISYKLNLSGPSLSIGTYCSTSGVAIHLACQSLRSGESDMALAGAVSLRVPSRQGHLYEPGNQGSPDGHTRTFDARAQGTVFSDGVAMVLLKRLEDALEDGDTIHAVIKGTAINNDGSLKAGFTAPSVERQAEVIAMALDDAELTATDIHYIEAHGTATELGDPIEVAALTRAFRQTTAEKQFCLLGSIKSNFGHADRAAGVFGVIKAAHILQTGLAPPTLHFEQPNPKMDLANSPFFVSNQLYRLPATATPRRAGVTALGVGGTNAHIILEQSPALPPSAPGKLWNFLTLSARTPTALDTMRENLAEALEAEESIQLEDAAFTLHCGRRELGERLAVVGRDRAEMVEALRNHDSARHVRGSKESAKRPVAFLFPGVGEQYVNMAAGLYRELPEFRQDMEHCFDLLREFDIDLRDALFVENMPAQSQEKRFLRGDAPQDSHTQKLNQTVHAQPC